MADPGLSTTPADDYYRQPRRDVAALVPADAVRILDVGCGFGALGRCLKETRRCQVSGIERNPEAARHLEGLYTTYVIGDVEASADRFARASFDCMVFADILEHLVDPERALTRYCQLLVPGGVVVASIPNVRNLATLYQLLVRGRWTYTDSGLLDRTHLRFFTRAEIHALFDRVGLAVERIEVNRDRYPLAKRVLGALPVLFIPDLSVCQFLVTARLRRQRLEAP